MPSDDQIQAFYNDLFDEEFMENYRKHMWIAAHHLAMCGELPKEECYAQENCRCAPTVPRPKS